MCHELSRGATKTQEGISAARWRALGFDVLGCLGEQVSEVSFASLNDAWELRSNTANSRALGHCGVEKRRP
jgi:hypothetical protein